MKTTLQKSFALFFGTVLLTSCETCDTATITPITEEDISWLAYKQPLPSDGKPDTVRFENELKAPVKFVRTQLQSSQVPGDGYSIDDKCIEQLDTEAVAVIQDVSKKMPGLATHILKKPNDLQVKIMVQNLGTYELEEQNPTHASLIIDDATYANVFEVNVEGNDTDNKGKIKRILFNKEYGFIRIEFYGGKYLQLKH